MPDEALVVAAPPESTVAAPTEDQIQNQIGMAMAFDDPSLMPTKVEPQSEAHVSQETPAASTSQSTVVDYTPFIKENFGVETVEDAKKQWQELQTLKSNPPKPAEYKFENEDSQKMAEAISKGDRKTILSILEKQERIEQYTTAEVTKDTAPEIIKLGMQLNNKLLTKEDIEFQYKELYVPPKEPVQRSTETDEEFAERQDEWKEKVANIEYRKIVAAKMAIPELEKSKSTLQLPNIKPVVDEGYEAYKASTAAADEAYNNVTVPGIKSLKVTDVQLGFKVDDANNQMQFDVVLAPTPEDFEKARQDSLSVGEFLTKTCYDKDGKFLPHKLQRMILLEQQFDNYAQSIARQAVNEERKRVIAKEAPNGNGSKDYNVNGDMTELQKQMHFALS